MKSWYKKSFLMLAILSVSLWGLFLAMRQQIRFADEQVNLISDLKDPSPFRSALVGHLDKMNWSLQGYVRSHDASMPAHLAQGQKDFEESIPEFHRQNPRLFPSQAQVSILKDYRSLKELIERLVHATDEQAARWIKSEDNFKQMLYLLKDRIRPLIKRRQPDAEERSASILKIENQLRAWQQDMNQAAAGPVTDGLPRQVAEDQDRGNSFLESYERLTLLPAEKRNARELRSIWNQNVDLSREMFALRISEQQSLELVGIARQMLLGTLNRLLPALQPSELESQKHSMMQTMRLRMATAGFLCLTALALTIGGVICIYRWRPVVPRNNGKSPTLSVDLKGQIRDWSPIAIDLYGYTPDEVMGKSIGFLFVSESEIGHLSHQLQSDKKTAFEARHKKKNAVEMSVRMEFRSSVDSQGKPTGIDVYCLRR